MKPFIPKIQGSTPEEKLINLIKNWNRYGLYNDAMTHGLGDALYLNLKFLKKETNDLFNQYPTLKFEFALLMRCDNIVYEKQVLEFCGIELEYSFPDIMELPVVYSFEMGKIKLNLWCDEGQNT